MKQSTFSAVMANSIKNLLQGYTKGIRFVAVLTMLLMLGIGQAWGETIYTNTGTTGTTNGITASGNINNNNGNTAPSFGLTSAKNKTITLTGLNLTSYTNVAMTFDYKLAKSSSSFSSLTVTQYNSSNTSISTNNITGSNNTSYKNATIALQSACTKITIVCNPVGSTYNTYVDNINITGDLASLPWVLKGSFDNWGDGVEMTEVSTGKATATLDLAANTYYEFKFVNGSNWLGNNGTINADISNWVFTSSDGNVKLNSGLGGIFTFTIDYSASTTQPKVSITYPRKDIYMACGSTWCEATPTFFAHAWRNGGSETYDVKLVQAPCESSVYIAENIPAYCSHVIFTRQTPGSTELEWDGANFWNQSEDITISTNDLFTCTGWNNGKGTFSGGTYTPPTYTITFSGNGNTGGLMSNVTGIPCEGSITLVTNGYTRTGYTFNNWKTNVAVTANSSPVAANGSVANKATISNITSNITLTAQWKANTYTITLNGNNGSGHTASVTATYNSATLSPSTITNPTRAGYTFDGWYSASGGTGSMVIGTDGKLQANVSGYTGANGIWIATASKTLYAKWTPITYYVQFNGNGSTGGSMSNQTFTYGTAQNLTANAFTRTGYTFAGWNTEADGSGTIYADKASVNNLSTTNGAIVNLYAKWTKVHTITWKVNGQQYGEKQEVVDGQTIGTLPDDPDAPTSCSDKVFMGWTESATVNNEGTSITYITISTKPDDDKTYYAVFATKEGEGTTVVTDKLTRATTGISNGSGYGTWSGKKATSSAVYAGQSAGGNDAIQIRTTNSNSGIISTTSGGKITKVSVVWNSNTSSGRTLNVYGKNSAYSAATDLYDTSKDGDMLGTIVYGTSEELTISGDYEYIGLRSASNAMYLTSVSITWSVGSEPTYTDYVTSCTPQHTITLDLDGGVFDETPDGWTKVDENTYTQVVNENTVVTLPTPTKIGYTYKGWRKNSLDNPVTSITATETATYTAVYDCALNSVGISGTYALVSGQQFQLTATAYDENGAEIDCPDNTGYAWQRRNPTTGNWEEVTDNDGVGKTLTYPSCEVAHCGLYRCHITYGDCGAWSHVTAQDNGYNVRVLHLKGSFESDWTKAYAFTATDQPGIATLKLDLTAGNTYNFKIYDGISEYGNGGIIEGTTSDWWDYGSDNNQNTTLKTGADGSYEFTLDFTSLLNSGYVLKLKVSYPPTDQASGKTIYYDNLVHNWANIYYRIGHSRANDAHNTNTKLTLVPGTSHLYKCVTGEYNAFEAWHIANNVSWSGKGNSIYLVNPDGTEYDITHATEYQKYAVVEDITLTPDKIGTKNDAENCTYYPVTKQSGMKTWKATVIPAVGGTITVKYTHHDGTTVNDFTSGDRDLAHTCLLTITATPDAGYKLGTLTVNDVAFTSGDVHTLTEDAVIKVTWTEKATPTFAWSAATCTAALEADNTFPTLNNPNTLPVTYTSSNTDVATIDANGNITLVATGPTTITADGAETATHKSATTTYELTVVESNCRWVETTTIEDGDEIVFIMVDNKNSKSYAMNNSVTSKNPLAEEIEDMNIFASSNVPNEIIWNIHRDENGIVFYSKKALDNHIYCTASYVKVGVSASGKTFTLHNGYIRNLSFGYLAVATGANTPYWQCYDEGSTNLANQTLKLYKRECLDASKVWVEGNLTNVTCDPQLPQQLAKDGLITLTFSAVTAEYTLPTNVSVKMGSTNLTPLWNRTTGELTINAPTGGFTDNVLVTVEALQVKTVTFSVGNGDTAPTEMQAEENTDIILPAFTTNLTCVKFVGWTDADNDAAITSSNIYKAGDTYTVTQDITLKAVYAAGGGFVLVTDANDLAVGDPIVIAAAGFDVAMGGQNDKNRAKVDVEKDDTDNTITTPDGIQILTLEAGTTAGTLAFNTGEGFLYAASSGENHLKTQATKDANGSWTISINSEGIATIKAQGSNTRNWLRYNSGSYIFSCYASGQADVSIYKESITGYTTDPECVMYNVTLCTPTNGTISVDKTIVDPYGSTILTFAPAAGYMLDAVTITSGTAEVGTVSYTSNQTSDGTVKISNIQSDIEVCATFKAIPYYKVTFIDMNADPQNSTEVFQSEFGGDITAPATASDGCNITWTFIGWAPSNELNGTSDIPANFVEAGGTISGANITSNLVYYSVYSNSSDGTPPFSIGKSGTYYMYALDGSTKYYATTKYDSHTLRSNNTNFESYPKATFKLDFDSNNSKYKIKVTTNTSEGYLYQPDTYDKELILDDDDLSNYSLFTIINGSETESYRVTYSYYAQESKYVNGQWVTESVLKTGNFGMSSQKFAGRTNGYDVYFEPASEMHYYNVSDCTDDYVTMSFHNPFGSSKAQLQYEVGYEEDYYTNTSKKYVDVFPTLEYAGWTFIGWTAGTPYNDVIGEDNLNDENSSAYAPTQDIYKTGGGLSYYLGGDVTMYPVFTKFEDNEPFDMVNGGDYYIYYIADGDIGTSVDEYGAAQRIYAAEYDDYGFRSTQSCADATLFTFTKLPDGKWTIYDNTRNKYVYGVNNDNKLEDRAQTADGKVKFIKEWTIEVVSGNQVNAVSVDGYVLSAYSANAVSGTFKNYDDDNLTNGNGYLYHRVYVGTCTERVYSSNPTNKPAITLSGEPMVTSTADQSIRAQGELSISATKLAANGTITLTSDNENVYFSTVKDANFTQATKPITPLPLYADEKGKLATTTVYVHYKPTSTSNLGILTATITATTGTEGQEDYATAATTAHVRNLSAKFVIATKVGATWYALPADMTTASNPLGVVIEVDETNMTATAPNSCTYTLFPVKTTNTEYDRYEEYGDRLRFSAVNNSYKGLWANNSKTDLTINNDMVIDQAFDGQTGSDLANNSYYEWKVTTTVVDGHWQYTLQTDQTQNQNYLRYWTSAEGTPVGPKWGTYNAGENKLYFLPVTETHPFEYAVVEWYPTKMLIQTDAAITSPTVKVRGEEVATPVLTSKGDKLYEISNLPLETNPNEVLQVSFTADAVNYVNAKVVPIILSRGEKSITGEPFATLTQKVYQYADVVVRDEATLTIDGGTDVENTLLGVTIYPTAKVSVAEGKKLSVHNLTFFGGIDEIYDGSAYTINKYGVPQLSLKGILNKTVTNMDYIMRVDLEQMYQVGVPYNVDLYDITYWDGTTMTLGDNLYVSAYDGQKRADREEKSWVWETDFTEKVLKVGIGYTISADKQDAAHEYSIIRMPMKNNITSGNTETAKTVQVYAYDNTKGVEITDNHKGWNYLSNPYMVAISGAEADSKLVVGYLRETGTGPWEWVDDDCRYVTIPSDDGKWYDQQKFKEATLLPFKSFFLQIATDGELSFALASRQNAPARYLQSSNEQREVEFEVLLANDTRSDNLGFLIGEDYTPAYEINADLEKMIGSMSVYTIYNGYNLAYNALSPANAEEQIPIGYVVPTVGEYTFALDESSDIEDVEHIYLIDYETSAITDLVTDVYTFTALEQKSDTRFAINVALKSKDNAATGLDNMNTNGELPTKFIYQDKIFILHHGVIYDATGKRVITINK